MQNTTFFLNAKCLGLVVLFGLIMGFNAQALSGSKNPFLPFMGTWTLKDDRFEQVWDGKTLQTLSIPNHITHCHPINTAQSVLCEVDAGDLNGHIMWSKNTDTGDIHHLSHFGESRSGLGVGKLDAENNFTSKVSFQGEPQGSYRIYRYEWDSPNQYTMTSIQYDQTGAPTGNWYGGVFVRIDNEARLRQQIIDTNIAIREGFSAGNIDQILQYHHPDVEKIFAWNDHQTGHNGIRNALSGLFNNYTLSFSGEANDMRSLHIQGDQATMMADFSLIGTPKTDAFEPFTFKGVTMIVYQKDPNSPTGWVSFREMVVPRPNDE